MDKTLVSCFFDSRCRSTKFGRTILSAPGRLSGIIFQTHLEVPRSNIPATFSTSFRVALHKAVFQVPEAILKRSAQGQYSCNSLQVFLQLLQVACKFSASCRKLVLQRCIAGIRTNAIQLHLLL